MNNLFSILLILFVVLFSLIFIIERFSKPISEAQTSKISSWIIPLLFILIVTQIIRHYFF